MPKSTTHIVCVGAVYIDTILTVPHFPIEDDKLRAKKLTKRRGGNTANSLEVLTQLVSNNLPSLVTTKLHLISVLPDKLSDATKFIAESLSDVELDPSCIFRAGHSEAASSYILQNELNLSRTIVSVNELDEMTVEEFEKKVNGLPVWKDGRDRAQALIHFEGRIPDVTLECVKYLRSRNKRGGLRISVECEKPERKVMAEVAKFADVVFYSRIWAEKNGYNSAKDFLESQLHSTRKGALLCCTWGSSGATAVQKMINESRESEVLLEWATSGSWHPGDLDATPVDSIGAGDTFVAGILFVLTNHSGWPLQRKLDFANELAGRKVFQAGFSGLGEQMLGFSS